MDVLFSNTMLLNKYNRKVPETWDQLLETAKYIKEEEKKLNNTEIIGYNGLFSGLKFKYIYIYLLYYIYI